MANLTEVVHFLGRVQGVGFRMSTKHFARGLGITGYVRNLPNGQVELVATAEAEAISRLIGRLKGLYGDNISDVERQQKAEMEEFSGFDVRR